MIGDVWTNPSVPRCVDSFFNMWPIISNPSSLAALTYTPRVAQLRNTSDGTSSMYPRWVVWSGVSQRSKMVRWTAAGWVVTGWLVKWKIHSGVSRMWSWAVRWSWSAMELQVPSVTSERLM